MACSRVRGQLLFRVHHVRGACDDGDCHGDRGACVFHRVHSHRKYVLGGAVQDREDM